MKHYFNIVLFPFKRWKHTEAQASAQPSKFVFCGFFFLRMEVGRNINAKNKDYFRIC